MQYAVLQLRDLRKLVSQINDCIEEGWEPLGGIQTVYVGLFRGMVYSQAIVKQQPDSE